MNDIIIVNWNSGDYLRKCVHSILGTSNETFVDKIIIVDNNSSDDSLKKIIPDSKIDVINNSENKGFSKACNQGFKASAAEYILLLNPDTQLYPTTLQDCTTFMNSHQEINILGCQLLDDNGKITPTCSRFPKSGRFFYDAFGVSKIAPRLFKPVLLMTDWDHKESRKVDQVMGAFMFMRKSVFEKIGYFDEQFFVYYEELDFSKRLADAGGITFFNAGIKAIHSGHGTTANIKAMRLFLNLQSRLKYAKKHFSILGFYSVWICTFLVEPLTRTLFLIAKGNFKEVKQVCRGYILLLKK